MTTEKNGMPQPPAGAPVPPASSAPAPQPAAAPAPAPQPIPTPVPVPVPQPAGETEAQPAAPVTPAPVQPAAQPGPVVQPVVEEKKPENLVSGIVGAFIGSLIGVACIVILGQLNILAAISGVVMAVCTIKGYELLGGSLSRRGVIVSVILMLVMTYAGHTIDWGIFISRELNMGIFEGIQSVEGFRAAGYLENFETGLAMLYLFVVIGAIPTIRSAFVASK